MKENRTGFIILTAFLLILLVGFAIVISPLDKKVDYFASGEIQLNQTQWQEFKTDCYKDKTDIHKKHGLNQFISIYNAHKDRFIPLKDLKWGEEMEY